MKELIKLTNIKKSYGEVEIIKNLDMTIYEGEFLTMLGPSGCGKTTILRMIGGFEQPTAGGLAIDGASVVGLPPYKRKVNTVFQNYALFPHLTIAENIAFGLKMSKVKKALRAQRVEEMLQLVQLEGYGNRKLDQLSGGQKQRVAIARAVVNNPQVLLLDEPLSALDMKLRKQMQVDLKRMQRKLGITFIFVTHDQEEALTMSDRIAVMNQGRLEQLATPQKLYEEPDTQFVANFIGESNIFYGTIAEITADVALVSVENGFVSVQLVEPAKIGEIVNVVVRPEQIRLSATEVEGFHIQAKISEHYFAGNMNKTVLLLPNGMELKMNCLAEQKLLPIETEVFVSWRVTAAVVLKTPAHEIFNAIENPDFTSVNH
jgi:spermidine/putrescine transport system ATP-binding protein